MQPRSKGQSPAPSRTCRRNTIARSFVNRQAPRGLARAPTCAQRGFRHTGKLCHFGHRLVCGAFIWLRACSFYSLAHFIIVKSIAPRLIGTPNAGLRTYMLVWPGPTREMPRSCRSHMLIDEWPACAASSCTWPSAGSFFRTESAT